MFQPLKIKDDYEEILATGADVLITAAYGQFVPTKLLKKFKKSVLMFTAPYYQKDVVEHQFKEQLWRVI
ncbi:MAG: hypothetical protein L6U99_10600 [Clostridium sp.]|nr:MAG: hypothetical protein L6U99_10600 [Clostridium sp.]